MSDEHLRMTEAGLIGNDDGPERDPPEAIERDINALLDDGEAH
jgi:hypothetical protein